MADAGGNDRDNGGTSDLEAFRGRIFLLFEKGYAFRWYEVAMKACIVVAILLSLCTIVAETVDTGCVLKQGVVARARKPGRGVGCALETRSERVGPRRPPRPRRDAHMPVILAIL